MAKSAELLKMWSQIKSLNNDITKRSILDAVGKYEESKGNPGEGKPIPKVETNVDISKTTSKEDRQAYAAALARVKQYQSMLTPALLSKYPDAKPYYDQITKQGVERFKTYQEKLPDYYLTQDEQKAILKDKYDQYQQDMSTAYKFYNSQYPAAEARGTEEQANNPLLYGLRSASMFQYTGEPREEGSVSEVQSAGKAAGVPKKVNY
jgi:hypothetical protein